MSQSEFVQSAPGSEPSVTAQLMARLKSLIASGVLLPGSKLPPERELAAAFGVSRSSLRHVLKAMEVMGILTQRVGDGTYLAADPAAVLREPFELLMLIDGNTLDDLLETRLIVEPELAARAAERAAASDIEAMQRTMEVMESETGESELIEADLAFHQAIFNAAHNPICSRLFSLIHRAMAGSIRLTSQLVDWNHTLAFHLPVLKAIELRQPSSARLAMIAHLSDTKKLLGQIEKERRREDVATAIQPIESSARGRSRRKAP